MRNSWGQGTKVLRESLHFYWALPLMISLGSHDKDPRKIPSLLWQGKERVINIKYIQNLLHNKDQLSRGNDLPGKRELLLLQAFSASLPHLKEEKNPESTGLRTSIKYTGSPTSKKTVRAVPTEETLVNISLEIQSTRD